MPVTAANLTAGVDADGNSSSTTASVTPTANKLQLLTIRSRTGISADPNTPTATGNGLTWVTVNSIVYDSASSSRKRITVLRAMGSAPTSGTIAIDFGGQNQTSVGWVLDEISGVDISGTNGSGAIVQSATNSDETVTTGTLTVTLSAFSSSKNATFGAFAEGGNGTYTKGTGFTELASVADGTDLIDLLTEFRSDNDTSVDATDSVNSELGGIAIEIRAAAVVASTELFMTTNTKFWGF